MADAPEDVDPLFDLLGDLRASGGPTPEWIAAHAPDRELGPLWRACGDPNTLLLVGQLLYSRRLLATAACACARTVVDLLPTDNQRSLGALEVAEGWTRGEIADDVAFASMNKAWEASTAAEHALGPVREASEAIAWAAQAAAPASAYANSAGHAARHAAAARATTGRTARERTSLYTATLRELSGAVRKVLSVPTLDGLIEAVRTARP
jgi:hypothetical protein